MATILERAHEVHFSHWGVTLDSAALYIISSTWRISEENDIKIMISSSGNQKKNELKLEKNLYYSCEIVKEKTNQKKCVSATQ